MHVCHRRPGDRGQACSRQRPSYCVCTFAVHVLMHRIMFDDGVSPCQTCIVRARVRPTAEERTLRHPSEEVSPWPSSTVATVNTDACLTPARRGTSFSQIEVQNATPCGAAQELCSPRSRGGGSTVQRAAAACN
jgi:hypothetical protein